MDWKKFSRSLAFYCIVLCIACFICYANIINTPFQFDDHMFIGANPNLRDLTSFFDNSRIQFFGNYYCLRTFIGRPFTFFSFALDYQLYGQNPSGFHLTNILIHLANVLLVYSLVMVTFKTPFLAKDSQNPATGTSMNASLIAFCSALIYAVHPVQTQAVTYITQRFTSLTTLLYLLSVVSYAWWRLRNMPPLHPGRVPAFTFYVISVSAAVLSMKSKEIAFTLPAAIALYEFLFFEERLLRRLIILTPLCLTSLIIPSSLFNYTLRSDLGYGGTFSDATMLLTKVGIELSRTDYLLTEFPVLAMYLRLLVFPVSQNLDYDPPVYRSFMEPNVFLSFALLAFLAILGFFLIRRSTSKSCAPLRMAGFGIFWFFITLSVESSIIPIIDIANEYRVYLASAALIPGFVTICFMVSYKTGVRNTVPVAVFMVIAAILSVATIQRNKVWQTGLALWQDTASKSPNKTRVLYNLGREYYTVLDTDNALKVFERTLQVDPKYAPALNAIGNIYYMRRDLGKARQYYERAVIYGFDDPTTFEAIFNLAVILEKTGEPANALTLYRQVKKMVPTAYRPDFRNELLRQIDSKIENLEHPAQKKSGK